MIRYSFMTIGVFGLVQLFSSGFAAGIQLKPASSCPAIFGNAESRAVNREARKRYLELVEPNGYLVNLTYSGPWREPSAVRFKGIRLVATDGIDGKSPSALLEVSSFPQGVDCTPAVYEIHVDDSLGMYGRVLAIVKDAVVFESDGKLFYLTASRAQEPVFRMIWRSTWTISGEQESSGSLAKPSSSRNYHKPKPIKHSSPRRTGMKSTVRR